MIGQRKRMDAVLPADEPLGVLLPDLLRLLDEPMQQTPQRRFLTTAAGLLVPPEGTLASAQIIDGSVLRLAAEGELPPPPTVYDVTEEAVEDLKRRGTTFKPDTGGSWPGPGWFSRSSPARSRCWSPRRTRDRRDPAGPRGDLWFIGIALGRSGNKVVAIPLVTVATVVLALTAGSGHWTRAGSSGW